MAKRPRLWYNVSKAHWGKGEWNHETHRLFVWRFCYCSSDPTASAEQDYDDLYVRILGLSAVGPAYDEDFDDLPEAAQALYVAAIFDMEMRCGGLCTFFCNEGPAVATRVSDSLRLLGLDPIADAYEDFRRGKRNRP